MFRLGCAATGKVFVLTPNAVNTVALCLAEAVSETAFRLIDKLSRVSPDAVYDSLRHYQRVFGASLWLHLSTVSTIDDGCAVVDDGATQARAFDSAY